MARKQACEAARSLQPKSIDEEIAGWQEWSFVFKNFMSVQDERFREDFNKAETASSFVAFESYEPDTRARALRLYSVLASYLKGRPLKLLKSVVNGDGFRVWRQLTEELQPASRPRALALAQALVKFPPLKEGGSVLEYTLLYEKLIAEYEKVSSTKYPDDLRISTLLSGLPPDIKRYLQLQVDDATTYEGLRTKLLQFERTATNWSTEAVFKAIGIDKRASTYLAGDGVVPMDVDRVEDRGKGRWQGSGKDAWGKKGKGKGKSEKGFPKGAGKGKNSWGKDSGRKDGFGKKAGKGKNKDGSGKGKGSSWQQQQGHQGDVRRKGPCYICGRMGHLAADCRDRLTNQVNVDEDSSSTATRVTAPLSMASSNRTASVHPSASASQVRVNRLQVLQDRHVENNDQVGFDLRNMEDVWDGEYLEEDWDDDWNEQLAAVEQSSYIYRVSEGEAEEEPELPSSSVQWFDLHSGDSDVDMSEFACTDVELGNICEDEDAPENDLAVRAIQQSSSHDSSPCEVILDSGADVTVLPMDIFGDVGVASKSGVRLRDAQGGAIPQSTGRANVTFEVDDVEGKVLRFTDKVILAKVKQPLLCAGKLMKGKWLPQYDSSNNLVMSDGERAFPLQWSRNSLAAKMRIYRLREEESEENYVRSVVELSVELVDNLTEMGWQLSPDGTPTHVARDTSQTVDPSMTFQSQHFPCRTTLIWKEKNLYEMFECGEYWDVKPVVSFGHEAKWVITMLHVKPVDPSDIGKMIPHVPIVPEFPRPAAEPAAQAVMPQDEPDEEMGPPMLGPELQEVPVEGEVVTLAERRFTEESSLRDLRWACKYLKISASGPKSTLWSRLKRETALNKLKVAVEVSDAIQETFAPDVEQVAIPVRPDPQTVVLHELTHLPRMPWCESCQASRSREDAHPEVEPRREQPVVSMDFMFARTGDDRPTEDHPLRTFLVAVDHGTKYVICVPVESKASSSVRVAVDEVARMLTSLGHSTVTLRADSEPAMIQLLKMVEIVRSRQGFATTIEHAVPDSSEHHGVRAERYIGMIRRLGLCLLHTVKSNTQVETTSSSPLFVWAFRHAAFLLTRYSVHADGCTSFELVHGRKYTGKIAAFGSVIFAQRIPKPKAKGTFWEKALFLGKSSLGNLNIIGNEKGVMYARTMRRAAQGYQADVVKTMKGVPWNPLAGVENLRLKRPQRLRMPELPSIFESALPEGPGDEAASDPPTSQDSILQQLQEMEAASSQTSAELLPDVVMQGNRVTDNGEKSGNDSSTVEFLRRLLPVDEEQGHEVELLEGEFEEFMDLGESCSGDFVDDGDSEKIVAGEERGDAGMAWEGRTYENGPPELSESDLHELDQAMEKKELYRLLKMGVMKEMAEGGDVSDKVCLQSKYVMDWRYRSGWKRRARLVAKEYRFLEPTLQDLYSPASVASTQKLLACLATTSEKLELTSIDVTDAYLQVPQRRPTFVRSSIGPLELLYTLPGQRSGSKDWHEYLKAVLLEVGCVSFPGSPALFAKPQELGVNSHVDDLQVLSVKGKGEELATKLREKGLQLKVEGPVTLEGGTAHFLKKSFLGGNEGILVNLDKKYIQSLVELLQLEKAKGKLSPCPQTVDPPGHGQVLGPDDHAVYRRCIGILLYISGDRPDAQFITKVLSSRCSAPTTTDLELLRHLVKYLKAHDELGILLEKTQCGRSVFQKWEGVAIASAEEENDPFGKNHLVEVVTDADWGSKCFPERRSVSSYCIYVNGNLCHSGTRVQKSISLSSAESELCGSLLGVSEALFVASAIRFMCNIDEKDVEKVKVIHYVDNSAARAIIQKEGLGKSRHVELGWLWIQRAHKEKRFVTKAISTALCPADLATKPHPRRRAKLLCYMLGMYDSAQQEMVGSDEFSKRDVKIRRVSKRIYADGRVLQLVTLLTQALTVESYKQESKQQHIGSMMAMVAWTMLTIMVCIGMCVEAVKYTVTVEIEGGSEANGSNLSDIPKDLTINVNAGTVEVNHGNQAGSGSQNLQLPVPPVQAGGVQSSVGGTSAAASTATSMGVCDSQDANPMVVRLGGGKCFHRPTCGMAVRFIKDNPSKVLYLDLDRALKTTLAPCKQCGPEKQ